jgi:hypothetical protein
MMLPGPKRANVYGASPSGDVVPAERGDSTICPVEYTGNGAQRM